MITKNSVVKIQSLVVDRKPLSWTQLYEDTNAHGYLPYNSAHRKYCRVNLLYNPAKCSIIFVSNDEKVEMRLKEFKNWLKNCHYPDNGINQSFYNAELQAPAPSEDTLKNIPFITTYYENIDDKKVIKKICSKLWNIQSGHRSKVFKNENVILSRKQPKSWLRLLTHWWNSCIAEVFFRMPAFVFLTYISPCLF